MATNRFRRFRGEWKISSTTILQLPVGIALAGNEWLEIVQNGVSVRITTLQFAQFVKAMTIPAQILVTGQQAITTSAVPLPAAALQNGVYLKSAQTNSGTGIFVGNANVNTTGSGSGTGYKLDPGDKAFFCLNNLGTLYVIGANGDVVFWEGS